MAKAKLKHNPYLTKEQLKTVLSAYYTPKGYEVDFSSLLATDLYIKKSDWTGVAIKLKQKQNSTAVRISGYAPSFLVRLFLYGIIPLLILLPQWRKLEKEVKEYISSEQFDFDCDTL